ncbi:MAG TPA: threo-3-hydroxy-L-aspartate ammonia-lyase [Candidatus Baltobacteraceae bacterium]|nr:threo-3-hydroxy-L-aspartate ammonia-lyase [Candidatus Baltobacteraceae bacterium]
MWASSTLPDADMPLPAPTYSDVADAAERIAGAAHRTPVLTSRTADARAAASLFFKCENFQRMGAFKFRGAYNLLSSLSPEQRRAGVVAFSSGNHAQGVALAARLLGVPATIVMPSDAPAVKLDATRGYGAEVVLYERERSHREEIAAGIAAERGASIVPPFEDPRIVAGAGTAALELLADAGHLDAIVVPCGGGGLMGGTALAAHGIDPAIEIYGVEPAAGDDFAQSLARGERVRIGVPKTIADGLQTTSPGELTFAIAQRHTRAVVTVSDDELREAVRFAFGRLKLVVEPSGGAAIAALLHHRIAGLDGKRVGAVISGGNVDGEHFAAIVG